MICSQGIIVSGAVIVELGEVLLYRDTHDPFWKFPWGKIEKPPTQESFTLLEETCLRECREELGDDVEIVGSLKSMVLSKPGDSDVTLILVHWLARRLRHLKNVETDSDSTTRKFDIRQLLSGKYRDETFAPNIVPVLENYMLEEKRLTGWIYSTFR